MYTMGDPLWPENPFRDRLLKAAQKGDANARRREAAAASQCKGAPRKQRRAGPPRGQPVPMFGEISGPVEWPGSEPPLEAIEQEILCEWLEQKGIHYHSTPNEGSTSRTRTARLRAMGLKRGFPDLTIDTPPPNGGARVIHVEEKRQGRENRKRGDCSEAQLAMHAILRCCGDEVIIGYGAWDTITKLKGYGYGA